MNKPQPKTNGQIRRMFGLAKPKALLAGVDVHDFLSTFVHEVTRERTSSLALLTFDEANAVITRLGGDAFSRRTSKRTENYRKQQAGIKAVETTNHLSFIDELAKLNGMTPEGPAKLAARMHIPWPPQTTEQGNKIVEALKAMLKRKKSAVSDQQSAVGPEPQFRRVA